MRQAVWVAAVVELRGPFCCVNGPKHSVNPPYCLCRAPFQMKCIRRALCNAAEKADIVRSGRVSGASPSDPFKISSQCYYVY